MTTPPRAAFLLNANARSVTKNMREMLAAMVPREHFYVSRNFKEAEHHVRHIVAKRYAYIFCGGGDGTVVSTINLVADMAKDFPEHLVPRIGVLRMGTGNALASVLKAGNPLEDVRTVLSGKTLEPMLIDMVENQEGRLTPFAGVGYDGELMNDFEAIKDVFFETPFRKFFGSMVGFAMAGFLKTLPRQMNRVPPKVTLKTSKPAYCIKRVKGKDEEVYLDKGSLLFDGNAGLICVGTIKTIGYNFTMFPFAQKRPGYMHLRVCAAPVMVCMSNLYPRIWHGTFRHPKLYDFLVKDVTIESGESLPYQFGGDAMGYKKKLQFKVSDEPVKMASVRKSKPRLKISDEPIMTPLFF